jgi:flagellar protein FlaJ
MVTGVSFTVGFILIAVVILSGGYTPSSPYWIPLSQQANNSILLAIILALSMPAALEFMNQTWLNGVEKNIPILLRDLSESVESGIPLITALEEAATRDYGPVTKPLGAAMIKLKITSDVSGSLLWLGDELKRTTAKRFSNILIKAYESGGKINDVLSTSVDLFNSISDYKMERRTQTGPYVMVVYIGTLVFFAVTWVLLNQFLVPLAQKSSDPMILQSGLLNNLLDINYYKSVMFWSCVMESLLGGLVAGKSSEGRIASGLIHAIILLVMTLAFFNSFSV